jgi:hypothetical protein
MPASKEYIKALQIKRLERIRPKLKLPAVPEPVASNVSYLFDQLKIAKSDLPKATPPLSVAVATLDDGRISLIDAVRFLNWDLSTCLNFKVQAGTLIITETASAGFNISASQGRVRLPLSARKLLSWSNKTCLLVVTQQEPIPAVIIYDSAEVINIMQTKRN